MRASERYPTAFMARIVPIPDPVPLSPLTVATALLLYRSDGRTFAIVLKQAYEKVAIAKRNVMSHISCVNTVGMSSIVPQAPATTTVLRDLPSGQPLRMRYPEAAPPAKFPRSAARNGIQIAMRPLLRSIPFATRYTGNQSVTKYQTGSVNARAA